VNRRDAETRSSLDPGRLAFLTGRVKHPTQRYSLSPGGLERSGRSRKEFAEGEGREAERRGRRESLGQGEGEKTLLCASASLRLLRIIRSAALRAKCQTAPRSPPQYPAPAFDRCISSISYPSGASMKAKPLPSGLSVGPSEYFSPRLLRCLPNSSRLSTSKAR
jgi:hypothetical protein